MLKDHEIRIAIKQKIEEALALYYTGFNPPVNVRTHSKWVIKDRKGKSAALLRAQGGRDDGKVHCWMIGTGSIQRSRSDMHGKSPIAFAMANGGTDGRGVARRDIVKRYKVFSFIEYDFGEAGNEDLVNSENELVNEFEFVADYLSNSPKFGLTDTSLKCHMDLQCDDEIDIFEYGEITANVAPGYIDVVMFRNL